jgi:hypothetical protein
LIEAIWWAANFLRVPNARRHDATAQLESHAEEVGRKRWDRYGARSAIASKNAATGILISTPARFNLFKAGNWCSTPKIFPTQSVGQERA